MFWSNFRYICLHLYKWQLFCFSRYKRVQSSMRGKTWKTEAELIKITIFLIGIVTFLRLSLTIANTVFDLELLTFYAYCMSQKYISYFHIYMQCYHAIMVVLTALVDIKTLILIRRYRNGTNQIEQEHRHIMNEIPMRSSLFNLSFLPLIIGYSLRNYWLTLPQPEDQMRLAMTLLLTVFLIKSPFITFLTFRVNETNGRIDQDEERERKRQLEIQDAKQRRNERIARQLAMQSHDG